MQELYKSFDVYDVLSFLGEEEAYKLSEFLEKNDNFNTNLKLSDYMVEEFYINDIEILSDYYNDDDDEEELREFINGSILIRSEEHEGLKYNGRYYGATPDYVTFGYALVTKLKEELPCEKLSEAIDLKLVSENTNIPINKLSQLYIVFTHEIHS